MPTTIPVPDLPSEAVSGDDEIAEADATVASVEDEQPAELDEAPVPYVGEVPALRLVPNPPTPTAPGAPAEHVSVEHRQSVLREVAFLDEL